MPADDAQDSTRSSPIDRGDRLTKILTKTAWPPAATDDARAYQGRGRLCFTAVHGGTQQSASKCVG